MSFRLKALLHLRTKKGVIGGTMFRVGTDKIHHNFET